MHRSLLPVIWTKGYLSRSLSAPGAGGRVTHKHSSWAGVLHAPVLVCVCARALAAILIRIIIIVRLLLPLLLLLLPSSRCTLARERISTLSNVVQGRALHWRAHHAAAAGMVHSQRGTERQSACTRGNQHALGIVHSQRAHRQADGGKVRKRLRLAVFRTAHLLLLLAIIEVRAHVDSNLLVV